MLEHMWGDGASQPYVPPASRTVETSIEWSNSRTVETGIEWNNSSAARSKTYVFVANRLSVQSLTEEQKEQVKFMFQFTRVENESLWRPEVHHAEKLIQAVERCRWYSDAAFRLRVYGEFSQVLNPHLNFIQLPLLSEYQKNEVKSFYAAALLDPRFTSQTECMKEALQRFASQHAPQMPESYRRRIESERAVRWNEAARMVSDPEAERYRFLADGWR
jgi:hypothetical protein